MATRVRSLVAFSYKSGFIRIAQIDQLWLSLASDTTFETPWILTVDGNERICDVCFNCPSALLFSEMAVRFLPTVRTHH
jgi:hypothetical protein